MVIFASILAVLVAQASSSPTPAATCAVPNHEAGVDSAMPAHYPTYARAEGRGPLMALVEILLDGDGKVSSAKIYRSSGSDDADKEAIRVARGSKYHPKIVNCAPTTGVYLFRVLMDPNDPD